MVKDFLNQLKYLFPQITLNHTTKINERLKEDFGKIKEDSFNFKMIEKYFRNKSNSEAHQILSDKTCNDLDFDDLFMFLDRTNSRVGQQYFYNKLRTIQLDEEQTKLNETIIAKLSEETELRISLQSKLENLKHKDAYYITTLFQDEHLTPPKWFFVIQLLSFTSLVSLILSFFNSLLFFVLIGIFCVNFVFHYWNKANIAHYVNSIPQLLKLNNVAYHLFENSLLKKINPDLPKSIKEINEIKNRISFFQLEEKLQGEATTIFWSLFELLKMLFLLEPLLLFNFLEKLNTKRKEIEDVFRFVGHIDMLISIASVRKGLDTFCMPTINQDSSIIAEKISHPLIFNCITNNILISEKSVLLTGSNMSGKTSFIRTIGLNIITGLTMNTCFAASMTFPLLKIFSAIRISDDLMNNKSYYFEEVLTIKEMIAESSNGNKNLFLLDEIFKGTNTVERISAGKAVLSALTKNNNIVFVSTHDVELTDMLSMEYELYHFSETVNEKTVGFDYKLKMGKLTNRNAIRILEINDYPKEVISEAIEISKKLDEYYLTANLKT